MEIKVLVSCALALGALTTAASAEAVKPGEVEYTEYGEVTQPLTDTPGDPENGAKIMKTKSMGNCISCHEVSALSDAPFHGEVGPVLDGVGGWRTEEELRGIVANAKKMFEGSVMPAFYKTEGFVRPGDGFTGKAAQGELDPLLSAQEIEDVVAFLKTLKDS